MSNKKFVCQKGLEVQVFSSYAGFYIGTFICDGEDVGPNCRCSGYYKTREQAEQALENRTFNRVCMENDMCHGGYGCQVFEITNPHAIIPFMKWCKQQCEYVAIDIETLRIDDDTIYLALDAFE